MGSKTKFTAITKIVGFFMVFVGFMGLIVLKDAEHVARSAWQAVYMSSIIFGGLCNLFDFGKSLVSKIACFAYTISAFSSVIIALIVHGGVIYFVLWIIALLISLLRYHSVSKATQREESSSAHIITETDRKIHIVDSSQPKCRVGIIRESKVSGGGCAFTVYIDGVKTTTIKNGGTARLLLSPGQHVVGFSGIGPKILGSITLDLTPGSDANIVCFAKGSGIEVSLTPVDVCSLPESSLSAQPASGGSGFFRMVFGLILLLLGLYILGVRLRLFIFLIPVK